MACCLRMHPLPTQMHMDARSRKHSEITQTTCDHHRSSHVLAPSVTKPSPRMKGCCRPRLTASCCCCCCCDSSPGVRVHTAHDDAPGVGTIECARSQHAPPGHIGSDSCVSSHSPHSHYRHLVPAPGVGPCFRFAAGSEPVHTRRYYRQEEENENTTDYDPNNQVVEVGKGRARRWAFRSAIVRA